MIRPLAPVLPAVALLCAMVMPGPLFAQTEDARLVQRLYAPDEVVRIEGKPRVQATIMFGDDEQIENVAIGDSQSWQVTPNKRANLLFVKPLSANATTNMTVVTDKRTYLFDLVASPRAKPLYMLQFTYPEEPEGGADDVQLVAREEANALEVQAARDPYAVHDPAALNFDWVGGGNRKLLPARTFDDGEATFLAWPAGTPVPAILIKDQDGTEGPVNFTVRGDVIVVEGVPREIVLRSGKDSASLTNNQPARLSLAPSTEIK